MKTYHSQAYNRWFRAATQAAGTVMVIGILVTSVAKSSGSPLPLNTQLGTWNGLTAYSNGASGRFSSKDPHNFISVFRNGKLSTIDTGYRWQCSEIAARNANLFWSFDTGSPDAYLFWSRAVGQKLKRCSNGTGIELPKPNDIVCWQPAPGYSNSGHVAVVREVGSNYIRVMEQNRLCDQTDASHYIPMTVIKNRQNNITSVSLDPSAVNSKGGYITQGWIRRQ